MSRPSYPVRPAGAIGSAISISHVCILVSWLRSSKTKSEVAGEMNMTF